VKVIHLGSIDSTNREAQRCWIAQSPNIQPIVVRADTQTAGIGRNGRHWESPLGGAWISIAWPMLLLPERYDRLTPIIAEAVARAIAAATGLSCRVKWPNDVLVGEKKLAGVLCQSTLHAGPRCIIVGIGVNANFPAIAVAEPLRMPATTLQDELGRSVDLDQLTALLQKELIASLDAYDAAHG